MVGYEPHAVEGWWLIAILGLVVFGVVAGKLSSPFRSKDKEGSK